MGWASWLFGTVVTLYFGYAGWSTFSFVSPSIREALPNERALRPLWSEISNVTFFASVATSAKPQRALNPLLTVTSGPMQFQEGTVESTALLVSAEGLRQDAFSFPGEGSLASMVELGSAGVFRGGSSGSRLQATLAHRRQAEQVAQALSRGEPLFLHARAEIFARGKVGTLALDEGPVPLVSRKLYRPPPLLRHLLTGESSMARALEEERARALPGAWQPLHGDSSPHAMTGVDIGLVEETRELPLSATPWQVLRSLRVDQQTLKVRQNWPSLVSLRHLTRSRPRSTGQRCSASQAAARRPR